MYNFGLLGNEYNTSILLLKRCLEDRGHQTTILNLTHLPRVVQSTITSELAIYDHHDLAAFDCYYLTDMSIRDPFFHVTYDLELWRILRPRYLKFLSQEQVNRNFAVDILNIIARIRPMVNPPHIYSLRLHQPFHLHRLADRGFRVPELMAAFDRPDEYEESTPLTLDEPNAWEVLSFPKHDTADLRVWYQKPQGVTYKVIMLGSQLLEEAVRVQEDSEASQKIPLSEIPEPVAEIASKATAELNIRFAEITCIHSETATWLMNIDPSPDLKKLEEENNLRVSSALADYLIDIAANTRT